MVELDIVGGSYQKKKKKFLAARGGTQFVVELGFCQSVFEGDSELVFNLSLWIVLLVWL